MLVDSDLVRPFRVVNSNRETRATLVRNRSTSANVKRSPSFRKACPFGLNGQQDVTRRLSRSCGETPTSCGRLKRELSVLKDAIKSLVKWPRSLTDTWKRESTQTQKETVPSLLKAKFLDGRLETESSPVLHGGNQSPLLVRGNAENSQLNTVDSNHKATTQGILARQSTQQSVEFVQLMSTKGEFTSPQKSRKVDANQNLRW
ncbi:hypothetical protein EAI_09640 [Harpegnathos saltator]|uniref:Uncharacterized protein n=1 Tax=Harpegnathos saltator TaxID=610380 RepID=E2BDR0_HARSA|nr:hypothetical protein EAI_09640 [Harpegnathos saltator]